MAAHAHSFSAERVTGRKTSVKPEVDNLKFDAALHYRITENAELSYSYRFGKMDGVFQRGNKIQLDDVVVQNHKLELKGHNYFVRTVC